MTADEFERRYAERSRTTVEELRALGRVVIPCACGDEMCEGWQSISRERVNDMCPFYGFNTIKTMGVLARTGGNQCALVTGAFAPCKMELAGQPPNWELCPYNPALGGSHAQCVAEILTYKKHDMGFSPEPGITMVGRTNCPECGATIDALGGHRAGHSAGETALPGAVAICGKCGAAMVVGDDFKLRGFTDEEAEEVANDPEWREVLAKATLAVHLYRALKRAERN